MRSIPDSLREYGRGIAGGLLFSLPLLYTMEMWWTGFSVSPERLIIYLVVTLILLVGYNRYAGLRQDSSMAEVMIDSVEELCIGLLTSAAVLFLMGRVSADVPLHEALGMIVIEAGVVAIGVSVGTAQLGGDEEDSGGTTDQGSDKDEGVSFGGAMTIATCGAVLFAANVAPTEEIVVIARETAPVKLIILALSSIVVGGLILFRIGFKGSDRAVGEGGTAAVVMGTLTTYAVGVVVAAAILWFFGRFEGQAPEMMVSLTVVLAAPATLGASAGRLLLGL